MIRADYKEMLDIPNKIGKDTLIDNYHLGLCVEAEDYKNPEWLKFVDLMKTIKPECLYKIQYAVPDGEFDSFRLDTYFDGFLPTESLSKIVNQLDTLCKVLPYMREAIQYSWIISRARF